MGSHPNVSLMFTVGKFITFERITVNIYSPDFFLYFNDLLYIIFVRSFRFEKKNLYNLSVHYVGFVEN